MEVLSMKFTEKELYLLSCGVLQLIEDASQAKKLLHAGSAAGKVAIEEYTKELQELNSKLCSMMND
jgi:hypothetical protein